ncbi:hypothetical protein [Brevundimonas sp.]|uniref:hypothetical protein n=1 Tax=Brevundimonas sp. TaxID=1871086 RepID=UPI0027300DB8|nr:hypothetical protein [Brevundimonas sp.]MDP1914260.1 hypothetical protein [Brevundimonas sp.]
MKIIVPAAVLLLAGAAHAQIPPAQTPPVAPVSSLTRDLNSGPPAPAVYLAPPPAPATTSTIVPTHVPSAQPAAPLIATPVPIEPGPRPSPAAVTTPAPSVAARPAMAPPVLATPTPAPAAAAEPPVVTPVPVPAPPSVTVLDSAARAALPFTADLPPGFEIVSGRPGPDFRIYTIRRGAQSFVMVYAGPASQFPIYSGQMVEAAGRASILSTEEGMRHAVEHLFQRPTSPREIHVWTMSLDGADRDMAERIAQSVDVR